MAPLGFPDDDNDGDHSQPDPHDNADLGFNAGPPAGALDQFAVFLKELQELDSMSDPDIMAAIEDEKYIMWASSVRLQLGRFQPSL